MLLGKRFEELGTVGAAGVGLAVRALRRERRADPLRRAAAGHRRPQRPPRPRRVRRSAPTDGASHEVEVSAFPILTAHGSQGAIAIFWPAGDERQRGAAGMKVKLWGTRGSIPSPGRRRSATAATPPASASPSPTARCWRSTPAPASAASASRSATSRRRLHILLTHLHLDHIQGLVFFAPAFRPQTEIVIWGPASPEASLRDRIARYISAPLSPVEVRELPCDVSFRHCPREPSGRSARRGSAPPRSPTAGRRSATGSTTATPRSPTSPTTSRRSAPTSTRSRRTGSPASSWPGTPRC